MPQLQIDISARLASFQDSLDKIGRQSEQMAGRLNRAFGAVKSSIAAIGVSLSAGAFAAFVKSGIDAADELNKLSQKVGVTVESLSALQYAAKLSDLSNEQLASSLAKLAKSASEASDGAGDTADTFRAIGVAVKDSTGNLRTTEELLLDVADRFSKMEDSAGKTAIAMRLFGKSGAEMIPFLNQGRAGLEALRKEAERLGIIISGETAKAAEEFNDNMTRLAASSEKTKIALAESLLPALLRVSERMAEAARNGDGMIGMLKSLASLSPFDDLQRAQKELSEVTDRILANEAKLGRLGDSSFAESARGTLSKRIEADKKRAQELIQLLGVLRGETNAFGEPAKATATPKKTKAPDISSGGDAFAALRARAEADSKRIQDALKIEETATGNSVDILGKMLDQNLINFRTFYDERARLQQQALEATIRAGEEEIAVAQRLKAQLPKESDRIQQDQKIADATARIEAARAAFAANSTKQQLDATKAAQDYAKALEQIQIELLEVSGKTEEAARRRFQLQNADLRERFTSNKDAAGTDALNDLERRTVAQGRVNELLQQAQIINDQLANAEARINIDRQSGAAGELTALQRLSSARQAALPQLKEIAEKYREIANSLGNPAAIQQAENFKRTVDELGASADAVGNKFREIGEGAFAQFFDDILSGTKSVKEAFADMGRSILRAVNQLVAQDIAKKIFGSFGGSGGSGGGKGLVETIGSFFGSLFGGARAEGGPVTAGKGYIVGERGPEWFVPQTAGTIVPNGAGGDRAMVINQHFSISGPTTRESQSQIAAAALRGLERGRRNL